MIKLHIKKGDMVYVLAGEDKGHTAVSSQLTARNSVPS